MALTKQYGFWQDKTLADTRKKLAELYFENPQIVESEKRVILEFWQSYEGLSQVLGEKLIPFKSWFFTAISPETVTRCLRALKEDGTITLTQDKKPPEKARNNNGGPIGEIRKNKRKKTKGGDLLQEISKHIAIARDTYSKYNFKSLGKVIYRYSKDRGVFIPDGEEIIAKDAQRLLEGLASTYYVNEVINWINRETQTRITEFDKDISIVNTLNCLLNIKTIHPEVHVPEYPSLVQLPVFYRPSENCLQIERFLSEI